MRARGLLVVMPAYNEEDCVGRTVHEVRAAVPDARILVVDDGSVDRTGQRARAAGAEVLTLPFNLGVGGAMRAGFKFAQRIGADTVVQVDADGQHDPYEIRRLLARLDCPSADLRGSADVVIGARFADKGEYVVRGPKRWAMVGLARTFSRMAGVTLTDTTSGFRATNRKAIGLYARHYPAEYLGDTVESLVIALRSGLRVEQVPVAMRPRQGGRPSQRRLAATLYLFRAIFALSLARVRRWPDYVGVVEDQPEEVLQ